jgi:hypothetical protein
LIKWLKGKKKKRGCLINNSATVNGTKKDVTEACDTGDSSSAGITVDCEIQ